MGYPELRDHQHILANNLIVTLETPRGPLHVGGLPWHFSNTPGTLQAPTEPGQCRRASPVPAVIRGIPGATDDSPKFVDSATQISRPF